jgi:hypothetical protein
VRKHAADNVIILSFTNWGDSSTMFPDNFVHTLTKAGRSNYLVRRATGARMDRAAKRYLDGVSHSEQSPDSRGGSRGAGPRRCLLQGGSKRAGNGALILFLATARPHGGRGTAWRDETRRGGKGHRWGAEPQFAPSCDTLSELGVRSSSRRLAPLLPLSDPLYARVEGRLRSMRSGRVWGPLSILIASCTSSALL